MVVRAFAPANISCLFRIYRGKTPASTGSLGVGITLDKGVIVSAHSSTKTEILVGSKKLNFPTVQSVIDMLTDKPVKIVIKNEFAFGCGFGMSGASALATAYAINKLLSLKKTKEELAHIAHAAEVINGTGLGDVTGQYRGGFLIKTEKGEPLACEKLPLSQKEIYYKIFGPIETKKVINSDEKKKKINRAGNNALRSISKLKTKNMKSIISLSKKFALDSGLLTSKKILSVISNVESRKGLASMVFLGESVYSTISFSGSKKATISSKGACLL